jgi:hypothetical protein
MAGSGDGNSLTGVRSRAMHRGQCSIVSQDALGVTLRPQRGQVKSDALPLADGSSVVVTDPSRQRGGDAERPSVATRSGHLQDALCAGDDGRVGDPVAPVFVAQSKRPVCRAADVVRHILDRKASRRFPTQTREVLGRTGAVASTCWRLPSAAARDRKPLRSPCPSQRSKTTPLDTF